MHQMIRARRRRIRSRLRRATRGTAVGALVVMLCAADWSAADPRPGRTDGPEGSEFGKGGYSRFREGGDIYIEGFFGAAALDLERVDGTDFNSTDLISGFNVCYTIQDYLSVQGGYGHIGGDQSTDLFSIGVRNSMGRDPVNCFFSIDAELYSPEQGGDKFGVVPGIGAELVVSEWMQIGLRFQRDFIFADDTIRINRFTTRLQFQF